MIKQLDFSAPTVVLSTVTKPGIGPVLVFNIYAQLGIKLYDEISFLRGSEHYLQHVCEVKIFFFSSCSFCVSPMSSNPQYVNELMAMADSIEWLRRRPVTQLYCYHCSNYQNSCGQFQILIGMNLKRCLNVYIMLGYGSVCITCYMREEFLWTNELNCHFLFTLSCANIPVHRFVWDQCILINWWIDFYVNTRERLSPKWLRHDNRRPTIISVFDMCF